jgi:hypothetical protein
MDALRVIPKLGKNASLEVSYLYDAYPRFVPYNVRGNQRGFYARLSTQQEFGNFGLNALRYRDTAIPNTTGFTLDFSLPVARNQLEFYGELGRDPFRRNLRTVGITLPGLYQRTGFDVYLEHARLGNSPASLGLRGETALRVSRSLNESVDLIASYNRYRGFGSTVLVGVSVGGRTLFRGQERAGEQTSMPQVTGNPITTP